LDVPENLEKAVSTIPLGRLGLPEDLFNLIGFLVNEATFITGQNFFVDGGHLMR
jgi:3-oxoacyl-[acyl-carrier protein] reductase